MAALERIAALHNEKQTWSESQQHYVPICDYDKTAWPCRTRQIIEEEGEA